MKYHVLDKGVAFVSWDVESYAIRDEHKLVLCYAKYLPSRRFFNNGTGEFNVHKHIEYKTILPSVFSLNLEKLDNV